MRDSYQKNPRLLGVLPNDDVLSQCIHCGMCLAVCPTYEMTKNERSSPRGRIKLIKSVASGEMEITKIFAEEMNFCLDCQACETACPAGVKYGSMVEAARVEVDNTNYRSPIYKFIKRFLLKTVVGSRTNLKFVSRLLRFYQNSFIRKLLHNCNCEVFTPKDQICCGSLQAHNGDFDTAKKLAKHTIGVFERQEFDYMISNSAGCGAFMKEYGHILSDDENYSERAKSFSKRVRDITEFLIETNIPLNMKSLAESITYHDACHLAHTQKITEPPRKMVKSIPGVSYNELEEASWCCGSAGIYNIVHYKESMVILERKMENIKNTNAKVVLTGNPGCLAQLRYGAKRFGVDVEVMHPVSLIKK